jgi:hypothetical protein
MLTLPNMCANPCSWARKALRMLIDLIVSGDVDVAILNPEVAEFAKLDPPFIEEMMREGLGEDEDLPPVGGSRVITSSWLTSSWG